MSGVRSAGRFDILVVCTGNIGRSPMMERLLRHDLVTAGLDQLVDVSGAGTWARDGEPMEPYAEQTLRERGIDADAFAARRLQPSLVTGAGLVLTATREHRSAVVQLVPAAVRRTFTLLELARVVDQLPPPPGDGDADPLTRMRDAVGWAAQNRVPSTREFGDDLTDPLGAPLATYRERADQIQVACTRVVTLLCGP
jgi:protein-tyrosine phosphatase